MLIGTILNLFVTPLMNVFSRKHEYEADSFARDNAMGGSPKELISALRKISEKNLSNYVPHPIFSFVKFFFFFFFDIFFGLICCCRFWNYSHPTLLEREKNLRISEKLKEE